MWQEAYQTGVPGDVGEKRRLSKTVHYYASVNPPYLPSMRKVSVFMPWWIINKMLKVRTRKSYDQLEVSRRARSMKLKWKMANPSRISVRSRERERERCKYTCHLTLLPEVQARKWWKKADVRMPTLYLKQQQKCMFRSAFMCIVGITRFSQITRVQRRINVEPTQERWIGTGATSLHVNYLV